MADLIALFSGEMSLGPYIMAHPTHALAFVPLATLLHAWHIINIRCRGIR
jgi:hypothetical protein